MNREEAANNRALATAFFQDVRSDEGKPARAAIVPYRAFHNPNGFIAKEDARAMQKLVGGLPQASASRDIASLLAATNWRFHALAGAAIGLSTTSFEDANRGLWMRIRLGCATLPQLVAAAAVADLDFSSRSQRLLKLRSTTLESTNAISAVSRWLSSAEELQSDPCGLAEKLAKWGPVGSRAIAYHHAFSRLRIAA